MHYCSTTSATWANRILANLLDWLQPYRRLVVVALTLLLTLAGYTHLVSPLCGQDVPDPLRGYSKFAEIEARLKQLESDRAKLTSLGKTLGERDIWLLTMGSQPDAQRPAILVLGNVVGQHVMGRELAMRMAEQMIKLKETDNGIQQLLESHTIYFIPSPTPDATEKNFQFPVTGQNGNLSPTDDDKDFETGEDPPSDLNHDGWITMMRVKHQFGTHRSHPEDQRVLIPVDKSKQEVGEYMLYTESLDKDSDGEFGEDSSAGVDFNRNFTFNYEYFGKGAGPHQVSERETRAVADFMFDHPNIVFVLCFSPEDNLFQTWKGSTQTDQQRIKSKVLTADQVHLDRLADEFRKLHGGKGLPSEQAGQGSFSEFSYFHFGRWTFASRGWWIPPPEAKEENKSGGGEKRGAEELSALAWFDSQSINGFVPWQQISHPDFPGELVEVGGFKPLMQLNPPIALLEPLVLPHIEFLKKLREQFPVLEIRDVKAVKHESGLMDVRCRIVNVSPLPSMPEIGSVTRQWYPAQVSLVGAENVKMIEGSPRISVGRLEENGGEKELRWIFFSEQTTESPFKIRITAPTLQTVEFEIQRSQPEKENHDG